MGSSLVDQLDSGFKEGGVAFEADSASGNQICGAADRVFFAPADDKEAVKPERALVQSVITSDTASVSEWKAKTGAGSWEVGGTQGLTAYEEAVALAPLRPRSADNRRLPTTPISSDTDDEEVASSAGVASFDRFSGASNVDTDTDAEPRLSIEKGDSQAATAVWIPKLFRTCFYSVCAAHKNTGRGSRKVNQRWVERTVFCLRCCMAVCRLCVDRQRAHEYGDAAHAHHPHIGICRYMYHDVVLAKDICREMDVSRVQSYWNNGQRVMYLVRGSGSEAGTGHVQTAWQGASSSGGRCRTCSRPLQQAYDFCSIFCLVTQPDETAGRRSLDAPPPRESLSEFCARAKREGHLRHVKPGNAQHQAMYERPHHIKPNSMDIGSISRASDSNVLKGRRARRKRPVPDESKSKLFAERAMSVRASRRAQSIHHVVAADRLRSSYHPESDWMENTHAYSNDLTSSSCTKSGSTNADRPCPSPGSRLSRAAGHRLARPYGSDSSYGNVHIDFDEDMHWTSDMRKSLETRRPGLNFEARLLRFPGIRKSRRKAWPVPSVCVRDSLYSIS
jgi:hypothetical protein